MSLENVIKFSAKKNTKAVDSELSESVSLSGFDPNYPHPKTGLKYNGFFPMRCIFFSPDFIGVLAPGEIILFLYLSFLAWRYPAQEGCVRAALPYLVAGIGESRATIHRYLQRLEKLGYIECLETNYKVGNLYRIIDLLHWSDGKPAQYPKMPIQVQKKASCESEAERLEEQSHFETAQIEHAQNKTGAVSKRDGRSLKIRLHPSQNETEDYTSLDSSRLSYSLSGETGEKVPDLLANYFGSIKAPKKMQSEAHCYFQLKKGFTLEEISNALDYIQGYGLPGTGERCHSPMAYLAQAMDDVQQILQEKLEKIKTTEDLKKIKEESERLKAELTSEMEAEFKLKSAAFEKAFPTPEAQKKFFEPFASRYPGLSATGLPLRNIGISAWWAEYGSKQANQI